VGAAGQGPANPWTWIATLIAAVIAAVAAVVGAVLQRRSGRESAEAAQKSAAAAERAAKAAEDSAKASQRLASVAEQESVAADFGRRADAMAGLMAQLMSPKRLPGEHEPLGRLNDYPKDLGEWGRTTKEAIAATWQWMYGRPEFEPMKGVRRRLEERIDDLQRRVAQLMRDVPQEVKQETPIFEMRRLPESDLAYQLDELLQSEEDLTKVANEYMQKIRLLLSDELSRANPDLSRP